MAGKAVKSRAVKFSGNGGGGFSLVELSIVLVILGLLVGGVMSGQSLIKAAELRSVSADFTRFQTAVNVFRDKYFALPGDMKNATSFWGAADGGDGVGSDCGDVASLAQETCNGDGNGQVVAMANGVREKFHLWKHLSNAGLIEGSFLGTERTAGYKFVGENYPASRMRNGGYELGWIAAFFDYSSMHFVKLAAEGTSSTGLNNAVLSSEEAWNLDTKHDDGVPSSGRFFAIDATGASGCVSNGTTYSAGTTGTYLLGDTPSCRIYYVID